MHRAPLLVALVFSLVATIASGQVSYTSQLRRVVADGGISGPVTASAPNFGDWTRSLFSVGTGTAEATQTSSLGPGGASLLLEARMVGPAIGSTSYCTFEFTPSVATTARLSGSVWAGDISLLGPGVNIHRSSNGPLQEFDDSVILQSGQSYTLTSTASVNSAGGAQVSATLAFSPGPVQQSRSFTYQGVVRDASGQPISTPTDMEFRLFYRPEAGGTQVGPTITANAVPVTDGLFSQDLDFGDAFNGDTRWLEVSVRNPSGSGSFTQLLPRMMLSSSPYANYALKAGGSPWSGITGVPPSVANAFSPWAAGANNSINYRGGSVGIGTLSPGAALDITTGTLEANHWQMVWSNTTNPSFRGGARLSNSGFFEMTNNANSANPTFVRLSSAGTWTFVSDARLKTDVTTAEGNLAAALKLRPVNFRWKADGTEDFGLIAQEVRDVLPRLVTGDESKDSLTLNYSQLSVVAIGAIQELKADNDRKQQEIHDLKARLAAIEAAILKMNKDHK